ncbi:hypothetical protein DXG01_011980, partial [Tephrocybe rancida]
NDLIPPIASLPAPQAIAGVSPAPLLASAPLIASTPLLAPAPLAPVLRVPGAIPSPLPVAVSVPDIGPGNAVQAPGPSPVAISAAGNPVHGPSGSKPKPKGDKVNVAAEKDTAPAEDDAPGDKGKTAPGKPDKEDMVIKGVHAFPCELCKVRGWVCQKRVGKDGKIGACAACYVAKGACTHSMKGKGKKIDDGATEAPKKLKPKRKAPKTPVYVSDEDDKATTPIPLPPPKRAHVIIPADPIQVVSQEDVDAARWRAQNARPHPAPLVVDSRSRSPTPGPSNDPLLAAALQAQVHLPSHSPPPEPRTLKRGDWFQEMIEYVDEVNASNVEHQQHISSAVGHLSGIIDALPVGAAVADEIQALASRFSDLEDSTDVGCKRLKERILKHQERCDTTSAHITNLEHWIQKMEESQREQQQCTMHHPSPIAAPAHQGRTFVSPTPSTPS